MLAERELADAIEVVPGRLFWVALHAAPKQSAKAHYFSIDTVLVYEPFFADFGPLNLAMIYRYCKLLEAKLVDPSLADKRIIHYCSHDPKKRTNAATLMCCYQVIALRKTAELALQPFAGIYPPFQPYRDASMGICAFQLTVLDTLQGLEEGIKLRWFDWNHFDVEAYEFFEKVENGDMNWIVPDKFLAFAGPCPNSIDPEGFPAFTPEDYVPAFREGGINLVVRLNKKQYDQKRFTQHGIKHVDLYFLDGSCPSKEILGKFLYITEAEQGAIGVHCKAGLGRTGTLIGMYCMKHFRFPARAFIGWNRICRPGSILGPQQSFLVDMETEMHQAGAMLQRPQPTPGPPGVGAITKQVEGLRLRNRSQLEQSEDVGQGDRLCNAKRVITRGGSTGGIASADIALPPLGALRPQIVSQHGSSPVVGKTLVGSAPRSGASSRRSLKGIFSC
mmetsp:Transcript_77363/g.165868  ORF Transcript_77363/g.165868 Transcript_77363/m.165868 type:complete len:447 (-) Transcript_77363:114-1454(-)